MSRGRKTIYTKYRSITDENVRTVVENAFQIHEENRFDIKRLIEYEKGNQPILERVKQVREEINERVVENHATQITNFKLSYVFGSPIRYVQKQSVELIPEDPERDDLYISTLNEMCFEQNKHTLDQELAKKFLVCGVGYRGCFQNLDANEMSPFKIVNLDPMCTFIIYSSDMFHRPMIAVTYWTEYNERDIEIRHYTAYTDEYVYEFNNVMTGNIEKSINGIGIIPIVEYRHDYEKMGCFERVLELLDAINICTSDRINGLAQFVQSFLWFNNVDIDSENFSTLKDAGAFATASHDGLEPSIKLIESSLNQNEVQTLADYLYNQVLQICCVPSREAQSGSTTGQSSMLAGGWQEAEEDAHRLEEMFDEGEKKFLKIVKSILDKSNSEIKGEIRLRDIDIRFSRNKVSNMLVKTQGLMNMKSFGIHPRIAIATSDLFGDAQQTYNDSKEYLERAYAINDNNVSGGKWNTDPSGNDPSTVKDTQNQQMEFLSK